MAFLEGLLVFGSSAIDTAGSGVKGVPSAKATLVVLSPVVTVSVTSLLDLMLASVIFVEPTTKESLGRK
jgi:hypothetical protein